MTTTTFPNQQQLVYSDEKAQVYLSENPCAVGHILVFPKETAKKIENIDAATFAHLISVASFASTAIFEGLGLQGTNILVQSGNEANNPYEQLCIQVIPRKFDDGLNFQWKPQKEEDMNTIQENINNYTFFIGKEKKEQAKLPEPVKPTLDTSDKENYLIKHLKRLP